MTAFDGLLLTTFPPVAIMIILGICCPKKHFDRETRYVIWFLIAVFLFMIAWRIPFVTDRRYVLPVIVPSIPLAILFFKFLYDKWHQTGKWLCGVVLLIIAISGTAKAMRFQEPKPYLADIPAIIHEEIQSRQLQQVYVMILGNIGGYLQFSDAATVNQIMAYDDFSSKEIREHMFFQVDCYFTPCNLLLEHPIMYIVIASNESADNFIKIWQDRYGYTPELCYEFTRPKDKEKIQMFHLESPYKSAYKTNNERMELYKKFNLLPNPDFSQKKKIPADAPVFKKLHLLNIKLGPPQDATFVPEGWDLYVPTLKKDANVHLEYTEEGKLSLSGKNTITVIQVDSPLVGGNIYQLSGCITVKETTYFTINVRHNIEGKWKISRVYTMGLGMSQKPGRYEFSSLIDLSNEEGIWRIDFGLNTGRVELESLFLVNQTVFNN